MYLPRLIGCYAGIWWKRLAQFRGTFALQFISHTVHYGADLFAIWILISKFESIGSWNGYEVVLLLGFTRLSYGIANFFGRSSFRRLSWDIQSGDFDDTLVRPLKPALYYVLKRLDFYDLYFIFFNMAVLVIAFYLMGIAFTFGKLLLLLVAIFGASLIQFSLIVIANSSAFWFMQSRSFEYFVINQSSAFTEYPISVYPRFLQILLTFVLPWAFVAFYPVQFFLGKNDFLFYPAFLYLTPLVGLILFVLASFVWRRGLRRYQSSGT